ncbi:MAG: histidine triad nucleotide-binding protein [Oscillospiraceae bacterium]
MDCLFCKIVAGNIPSQKVYEDESVLAFYDIEPQAPVHVLIIPKKHISSVAELTEEDASTVAHIFTVAAKLSRELHLDGGFRIVTNSGKNGAQSVKHLHFHLLGGRQLTGLMG